MGDPETAARDGAKIRLAGVRKSFGPKLVLDGLDLEVADGESVVVIGRSGTGKSVMLKHIIGLMRPDAGEIAIDGVAIHALDNRALTGFRRRFGMAFQEGALFDSMTVFENIAFPLRRQSDLPPDAIAERVRECLALVHLEGVERKMPSELSGGMRRRVGFARAIAHEPEILLFDEPTSGLDPVTTAVIDDVICGLLEGVRSTAVTITHDLVSAFRIADRIGMLHQGRIIAIAPPEEFRRLDDPRVQQFLEGRGEGPLDAENRGGAF